MNNKNKINKNKTISTKILLFSLLVAFVLVMSGPAAGSIINSNYAYAAKSSGGGGSSGGSSGGSGGGSSSGGSKGGGDGGGSGSNDGGGDSSSKGGSSSDSSGGKGGGNGGGGGRSSDSGSSSSGSSNGAATDSNGNGQPIGQPAIGGGVQHNPNDDGFTSQDGPQPKSPFPFGQENCAGIHAICKHDGDTHKDFCRTHPGVCHFPRDNDVKVIHKTVVVHDRDNNPQTIILNANLQGTCFVTQTQIVNIPGLVAQLLDQCASVTIVPG